METQLAELTRIILQLGTAFLFSFWFLIVIIGLVVLAEFVRRERTVTKDDDWVERKSKMCCEHIKSEHVRVSVPGVKYTSSTMIGKCTKCECQRYYRK